MQSSLGQQNIQQNVIPQAQYQTAPIQQQAQPVPTQALQYNQAQPAVCNPQYQPQNQNVQVPNYSGVNIQIFNPSVTPPGATAPVYNVNAPNYGTNPVSGCYPSGYYTNNWGNPNSLNNNNNTTSTNTNKTETTTKNEKKTEKKEIVQLTDDYIRNLENYLNNQNQEIRLMGAKEVIARLEEDHSRKDDKALNALVNKMLQDPYTPVKVLAMGALDSRIATGDNYTVGLLTQMQNSKSGYGQDALQASNILLKMSGQKVEKEFEVKDNNKNTQKNDKK